MSTKVTSQPEREKRLPINPLPILPAPYIIAFILYISLKINYIDKYILALFQAFFKRFTQYFMMMKFFEDSKETFLRKSFFSGSRGRASYSMQKLCFCYCALKQRSSASMFWKKSVLSHWRKCRASSLFCEKSNT
jgi:hypothetical protein